MPDYKVYVPEAKAAVLYQYKEQFGKGGSGMIVGFMENALANTDKTGRQNPVASTAHDIYQIYFGDIESEKAFLYLFDTRESAGLAL